MLDPNITSAVDRFRPMAGGSIPCYRCIPPLTHSCVGPTTSCECVRK